MRLFSGRQQRPAPLPGNGKETCPSVVSTPLPRASQIRQLIGARPQCKCWSIKLNSEQSPFFWSQFSTRFSSRAISLLVSVLRWCQISTAVICPLETVLHWSQFSTGVSSPLVSVLHQSQFSTVVTSPLVSVLHWRQFSTGDSSPLETVLHWRELSIGVSSPPMSLLHWSHSSVGTLTVVV